MEKFSRKQYARYLQNKFENYFEDFSRKTGKTKEALILEYCSDVNSTEEDMYNIDTVLNFLADYGSYYLHELEEIEESNDYENIEKIRNRIEEIDREYDILEKLIYNTGENYVEVKKEGIIDGITMGEKEKAFNLENICTDEEMRDISKWLKCSYLIFLENYRNKSTSLKAGKVTYNFEITEENLCHLLGIEKRNLEQVLRDNNIGIFEIFMMLIDEGKIVNRESPLERITRIQKESNKPLFNYQMIKYKNYLFQNFGILSNVSAICTNAKPKMNNRWLSDTFLLSKLSRKCGKDNYSQLGFFNSNSVSRTYIPETLQSTNTITNGIGEVYNVRSIFKQAKGTAKDVKEKKIETSKMELCCIFSAREQLKMIEKILEDGEGILSKENINELKIYYYRIYSSVAKFNKTREILKEKALEKNNGRSR